MSVVAVLTTCCTKAAYVRPVLTSIVAQEGVDRTLLVVGDAAAESLASEAAQGLDVTVQRVQNIGPGRKHLGALHCSEGDVLVVLGNDVVYAPGHVAALLEGTLGMQGPIGGLGFTATIPPTPVLSGQCDFLHGQVGWVYLKEWLDTNYLCQLGTTPACFASDDVYTAWVFKNSGYRCTALPLSSKYLRLTPTNYAARTATISKMAAARYRTQTCLEATFLKTVEV